MGNTNMLFFENLNHIPPTIQMSLLIDLSFFGKLLRLNQKWDSKCKIPFSLLEVYKIFPPC